MRFFVVFRVTKTTLLLTPGAGRGQVTTIKRILGGVSPPNK